MGQKISGIVLSESPSKLTGKPIVVIATLKSSNIKTGNLVQTWILPKNMSPTQAMSTGKDDSICSCDLRGQTVSDYQNKNGVIVKVPHNIDRICYVVNYTAPNTIWKKFQKNKYPPLDYKTKKLLENRKIRLGSLGDPSAVNANIWRKILKISGQKWTGYTANWANGNNRYLKRMCQASVYTISNAQKAQALGWFTFRISQDGTPQKNEIVCPASINKNIQCIRCMLCNGNQANVVIKIHGSRAKISSFSKLLLKNK